MWGKAATGFACLCLLTAEASSPAPKNERAKACKNKEHQTNNKPFENKNPPEKKKKKKKKN